MKRSIAKFALFLVILVAAAAAVLFFYSSEVATKGIRYALAQKGIEPSELSGVLLTSSSLSISKLSFPHELNEMSFLVSIENAKLNYRLEKRAAELQLEFEPSANITLSEIKHGQSGITDLSLTLESPLQAIYQRPEKILSLAPASFTLKPFGYSTEKRKVKLKSGSVRSAESVCQKLECEISLELNLPQLEVANDKTEILLENTLVKLHVDNKSAAYAADVKVGHIKSGISVKNLAFKAKLKNNATANARSIRIQNLSSNIFNGTLHAKEIPISLNGLPFKATLAVAGIDIEEVLRLYPQKNISGTGLIDGKLPLTISSKGVSMANGELQARGPGLIRYRPDAVTDSLSTANSQFNLLLQALGNYQYEALNVTASYKEDGNLLLAVSLAGSNPDYNKGQAINFNLNIEENIPALMKSLQAGKNLKFDDRETK